MVALPSEVTEENSKASFKNGVLEVQLRKKEGKSAPVSRLNKPGKTHSTIISFLVYRSLLLSGTTISTDG